MSHVDGVDDGVGYGVSGKSTIGAGVVGESNISHGVHGKSVHGEYRDGTGVYGEASSAHGTGVYGDASSAYGIGVRGDASSVFGRGVYGAGWQLGVHGRASSAYGIGVRGYSVFATGVSGFSLMNTGVFGESGDGKGVVGSSSTDVGVEGTSPKVGVRGLAFDSRNGIGIAGIGNDVAVFGWGGNFAGWFIGNVHISGSLTVHGTKSFKIDHPLDPSNKYLCHSSVESPDMKNVYDGVVVLDDKGEAVVVLPDWFEALNKEFCYQLTPISAPGPNLYIAEEIKNQRFKIAGGSSGMKVCWQVTGIRQDAWAQANPLVIEQDKSENERDYYLHPEVHGYQAQKNIAEARYPEEARQFREIQENTV